jgi:hypothetical protein
LGVTRQSSAAKSTKPATSWSKRNPLTRENHCQHHEFSCFFYRLIAGSNYNRCLDSSVEQPAIITQPLAGINKLFADFHTVPLTAIGLFSVPLASTVFYRTPMVFWHLDREMIKLIQLKDNALGPPVLHHVRPILFLRVSCAFFS